MSKTDLYVVVGLGVTGVSCARFLESRGIPYAVMDTRTEPPLLASFKEAHPEVEVFLGGFDENVLSKATTIVLSPGVAMSEPAIASASARGVPVIGDVELFARAVKAPVVAITGTNAKSTVTTLVGEMVKKAGLSVEVGGNLGIPVLDLYMANPRADVYVLELSSFQLETTFSLKASVATVLNVTPDHMDRYATLSDYQRAKQRVYQGCEVAVCNADDPLTDVSLPRKYRFTMKTPQQQEFGLTTYQGVTYLAFEDKRLLPVTDMPVAGKHYQANALAALAIGLGCGLPWGPMLEVLRTFPGLRHRCQFVRECQQVTWYNDSKGTNVGATQAAVEGLGSDIPGKLVLIAGGVGKSADFSPLTPLFTKYVRHAVLIGEAASDIEAILPDQVTRSFATSMGDAVQQAQGAAHPGDAVLLSPACASFDMFKNFEHRGDVFMEAVAKLSPLRSPVQL